MTGRPDLVLVVDDDTDLARFIEMNLRFEGFSVVVAHDGEQARELVRRHRPDLVLVDVMMPRLDGVQLTRQLRADPMSATLPIIMLTAKGLPSDKVVGLTAGADDYVLKPFDTGELVARIRSTLRRHRETRELSPLTGLPGNVRILREIANRVRHGQPFAVCYVDIDGFKSVNDAYGFVRGDEFIVLLADALLRAVVAAGHPPAFLGHVGGDDFLVLCSPGQVAPITDGAIRTFEEEIGGLYDPVDAGRGYVEVADRRARPRRSRLVTLSVGVAVSTNRRFSDPREAVAVATEMKHLAKGRIGSYVAVDRRSQAS